MTINERIDLLMRCLSHNNNSFAKAINVNPTVTFNIISGRNTKPSFDLLEKILSSYDNIDANWLIKGQGEMFVKKDNDQTDISQISMLGSAKTKTSRQNNSKIEELLREQLDVANRENGLLLDIIKNLSSQK